jgi:ABC-type glycerol-3-phosphate transport system permease component
MRSSRALTICRVALLWAAGISVLFPVAWIALASVKSPEQLNDPVAAPSSPS